MNKPSAWVTLAHAVRPQGRRGELLCNLHTDFPEQLHGDVSLLHASGKRESVRVESHWLPTGRSAGRVVLKFTGVDSITEAEALAGSEVQVPADQRLTLEQGMYYISDLIGCTLVNKEASIGTVEDIQMTFDRNGRRVDDAAALFVLRDAIGTEVLIPFANAYVRRIDTAAKIIEMSLPEGLVELNRGSGSKANADR